MSKNSINRRDFLSSAAVIGAAGTLGSGAFLTSCAGNPKEPALIPLRTGSELNLTADSFPDKANDGRELKVGLVGCGGQGTGDLTNLLRSASGVKVVALGDMFKDRIDDCRKRLKERLDVEVPDDMCFDGFDAYKRVIESDIDMVMLITAPAFRPLHFKAAVDAGKHVFMEKPLAVDPVGVRSIMQTAKQPEAENLCIICGTQRHHSRMYNEGYKQVQAGVIGEIVSGNVYWNQSYLWHRDKDPKWTTIEWMIRDWVNWNWLSGDHIVEQHIHNIDVFNWFSHLKPISAVGFGSRQRRITGDQYDNFSVDYVYEGGVQVHSMCRQMDGCANLNGERIVGTKGIIWANRGLITDLKGNDVWKFDREKEKEEYKETNEFALQFVNWVNRIRSGKPINQAEETAISTMTAIMGRISAYTGARVTWDEVMAMDMDLMLDDLTLRKNVDLRSFPVPVPGKPRGERN